MGLLEADRCEEILRYYDEVQRDTILWRANITKIKEDFYQAKALILAEYCYTEETKAFEPSLLCFYEVIDNFEYFADETVSGGENISFDIHDCNFYETELNPEVAEIIGDWLVDILNDEGLDGAPEYRGIVKHKIKDPIIKKLLENQE